MLVHPTMKLGVIPSDIPAHAPSLRAHAVARIQAPAKLDRSSVKFQPRLCDNDRIGSCAEAALVNTICWQAALAGYDVDIPDQRAVDLYSKVTGYVPGNQATDQGTELLQLLTYQAQHGFRTGDPSSTGMGGQTEYDGLWAALDPQDLNLMRVVMAEFGGAYGAFNLAEADQVTDGPWRLDTPASYGDPTPGSWGPHCMHLQYYTGLGPNDLVWFSTWGTSHTATWEWVRSHIYQLFSVYHPQMIGPNGHNPAGLDRDRLAADVASFGAVA